MAVSFIAWFTPPARIAMAAALLGSLAVACSSDRQATTTTIASPTATVPRETSVVSIPSTPVSPPRGTLLIGPTVLVASSAPIVTGQKIDPLARALESRDVDGVLRTVGTYFQARGCDGDEWSSRAVLDADREDLRTWFEKAFARGVGSSVYAIAVGPVVRGGGNDFQVWVSASQVPSPTAPATFWLADEEGRLTTLEFLCGRLGAGARTGAGASGYLVAPRAYCVDGAAEAFLEVEETGVDEPNGGVILGKELLRDGTPTGGPVEVTFPFVDLGTNFLYLTPAPGAPSLPPLYVGAGSRLRVEGLRQRSCIVQASKFEAMP